MSTRRAQSLPPHMLDQEKPERGRCVACICFTWKVITCILSHVTLVLLVVSYCVGGAYLFRSLEKEHSQEVKRGIHYIRKNITERIWRFSDDVSVLNQTNWTETVKGDLIKFEEKILAAIETDGWDGDEDINDSQWTFVGSLFYSIIVITTIGYGHISPRTDWGKITTIFYAIVGIPLMLLCLSNIGDIMATSFRFIYWRICCYACTRPSRRSRNRSRQRSIRAQRYSSRSQPPPFRRSMKLTQRSGNDSGMGASLGHAYSDPELRTVGRNDSYRDLEYGYSGAKRHHHAHPLQRMGRQGAPYDSDQHIENSGLRHQRSFNRGSRFSSRQSKREGSSRGRDLGRHTVERERYLSHSKQKFDSMENLNVPPTTARRTLSMRSVRSPNLRRDDVNRTSKESRDPRDTNRFSQTTPRGRSVPSTPRTRAKSVEQRNPGTYYGNIDEDMVRKTPIIPNRYALDDLDHVETRCNKNTLRSQSMPRSAHQQYRNSHYHEPHNGGRGRQYSRQPSPNLEQSSHSNFTRPQSQYGNHLELPEFSSPHSNHQRSKHRHSHDRYEEEFDDYYMDDRDVEGGYGDYSMPSPRQKERKPKRDRTERLPPSPRIMSPMGFAVMRQVRRRPSYDYDDDSMHGDEWSAYYGDISPKDRPVPIWLCVFLVISYIIGGALLFAHWENWEYLDSAYFCFITLTTIGFGDFVPAKGVKEQSEQSIAYCSLYLLFGIALLAMSFNLVQEEFIANVKELARRLGILKDDEDDE